MLSRVPSEMEWHRAHSLPLPIQLGTSRPPGRGSPWQGCIRGPWVSTHPLAHTHTSFCTPCLFLSSPDGTPAPPKRFPGSMHCQPQFPQWDQKHQFHLQALEYFVNHPASSGPQACLGLPGPLWLPSTSREHWAGRKGLNTPYPAPPKPLLSSLLYKEPWSMYSLN